MERPTIAILAIFSIAVIASMGFASAFMGFGFPGPRYNEEVHSQLMEAIESGDYELWSQIREENALPLGGRIFSEITEENFDLFRQLHEAVQSGDMETAGQIREQLGLGPGKMFEYPPMPPEGGPMGHRGGMEPGMRFVDRDGDGYCDFSEQEEFEQRE